MSEDVLKTYEFHVQIAEEDVRDGDATPWERVVAAFASTIRELRARVAELETRLNPPCPDPGIDAFYLDADEAALEAARREETQCDRCGLKLAHEPTPGINYGPVVTTYYPPVVTNAPDQLAQVTFYPQEVIYRPGELSQYPSKTVGEP